MSKTTEAMLSSAWPEDECYICGDLGHTQQQCIKACEACAGPHLIDDCEEYRAFMQEMCQEDVWEEVRYAA